MKIRSLLEGRVNSALRKAGAPENSPALIQFASRAELGDYQANGAIAAARKSGLGSREFAEIVIENLELSDIAESVTATGPGFINIRLSNDWLCSQLGNMFQDERLGVKQSLTPETIVVDYSSPNLAKEMHVGHLRSSIIGDSVCRVLKFLGHNVIRQNHVGDWGTQFGMLIAYIDHIKDKENVNLSMMLADLEEFYRAAKKLFDADENFANTARQYVVQLQSGNAHCIEVWKHFIDVSLKHCEQIYEQLNIELSRKDVKPESSYQDDLSRVIEDLKSVDLLTESDGAQCVFLDEFKGKDDKLVPLIVKKSDGGYLYATTDLAAIRYRANTLKADRILYFVDTRQKLHLKQCFAVARQAGFVSDSCSLEHHAFGTMMGQDGKPFKTREGENIKLVELLKEGKRRALEVLIEKDVTQEEKRQEIADVVGIGAIKYADLSMNRISNYVFSWENMLSFEGNTASYLLYAFARIKSIFRKAGLDNSMLKMALIINEPAERSLAIKLLQFEDIIQTIAKECYPHILCTYLYELAGVFMHYYEACPVIKASEPTRTSRLKLCLLTANTMKCGLDLLGIKTIEQM